MSGTPRFPQAMENMAALAGSKAFRKVANPWWPLPFDRVYAYPEFNLIARFVADVPGATRDAFELPRGPIFGDAHRYSRTGSKSTIPLLNASRLVRPDRRGEFIVNFHNFFRCAVPRLGSLGMKGKVWNSCS